MGSFQFSIFYDSVKQFKGNGRNFNATSKGDKQKQIQIRAKCGMLELFKLQNSMPDTWWTMIRDVLRTACRHDWGSARVEKVARTISENRSWKPLKKLCNDSKRQPMNGGKVISQGPSLLFEKQTVTAGWQMLIFV